MLQLEVISPTSTLLPLLQFETPNVNISFENFLMKTTKFVSILSTKFQKNIEKGIFSFSFEGIRVEESILQQLLNFINGEPLIINELNFEALLTVGSHLEIPIILEKAFFFSEVIDIRSLLFDTNSGIPEKITTDIIASVFDLFYTYPPLKDKIPFFIQAILLSDKLTIQKEEDLCSWLIDYRKHVISDYDADSLMLFSYIHAENLTEEFCKNLLGTKDINVQIILMEKRLTFDPDSNDQTCSSRYINRTTEQLFAALVNQFSFMPIYIDD